MKRSNSEIMAEENPRRLTLTERQIRFCIQQDSIRKPCPSCAHPNNVFDAAKSTIDGMDYIHPAKAHLTCSECALPLRQYLPLVSLDGWRWIRDTSRDWTGDKPKEMGDAQV